MEAVPPRPTFSIAVHTYLWLFFALLGLAPIFVTKVVSDRITLPTAFWIAACVWPISLAILFVYALRNCSSDRMTFRDGLLWITSFMLTGWMYQSFFTVSAGLAGAYVAAIFAAVAGEIRRAPHYASEYWLQIVRFFYRHRMRQ